MAEVYLTRTVGGFAPANDDARDSIKRFKIGDTVKVDLVKPRNYEFHKKAMSLLRLGFNNLPEKYGNMSFENYRKEALKAIGWSITYRDFQGREVVEADSMRFARLDDDLEFEKRVFSPLINFTLALIGLGEEDREDLEREVIGYAG